MSDEEELCQATLRTHGDELYPPTAVKQQPTEASCPQQKRSLSECHNVSASWPSDPKTTRVSSPPTGAPTRKRLRFNHLRVSVPCETEESTRESFLPSTAHPPKAAAPQAAKGAAVNGDDSLQDEEFHFAAPPSVLRASLTGPVTNIFNTRPEGYFDVLNAINKL